MSKTPPFNRLRNQLLARGLPWPYVRRYVTELRAHHHDLLDELLLAGLAPPAARAAADQRLGNPNNLLQSALRQFRRRTFLGRHPLFFYALSPLFILTFILCLIAALCASTGNWLLALSDPVNLAIHAAAPVFCAVVNCLVPTLLALFFYRSARRHGLSRIYRLIPVATLALLAFFLQFSIGFAADPDHGFVSVGFFTSPQLTGLLPVACTMLAAARTRRHLTRPSLAR